VRSFAALRMTFGIGILLVFPWRFKLIEIHPQYLVDEQNQKKAVVLPFAEWEQLLDELEELDDIRAYDKAKTDPSEAIPFEDCVRELKSSATQSYELITIPILAARTINACLKYWKRCLVGFFRAHSNVLSTRLAGICPLPTCFRTDSIKPPSSMVVVLKAAFIVAASSRVVSAALAEIQVKASSASNTNRIVRVLSIVQLPSV
jgi:hypothetical protein